MILSRRGFLPVAVAAVAALVACDSGCDGIQPLDRDLDDADKVYDGVQLEVSPDGFAFLEDNIDVIIDSLMEDGLTFEIDPDRQGCDGFTFGARVCNRDEPCPISAALHNVLLVRKSPNLIEFDADLWVYSGTSPTGPAERIPLRLCTGVGSIRCDVRVHMSGKPLLVRIVLDIDPNTKAVTVTLREPPDLEIEESDVTVSGDALCHTTQLSAVMDAILGVVNDMIQDEFIGDIDATIDEATCMDCDFFNLGCEEGLGVAGLYCDEEDTGWCKRKKDDCVRAPLGIVGQMDLGELLGDMLPGGMNLGLHVGAGQRQAPWQDPFIPRDGGPLQLRMVTGAAAEFASPCVPEPASIPSTEPPPRVNFDAEAGGFRYHVGIGISDRFLNKALYEVYLGGGLCLDIDSEQVDMITTGLFATFLPSLGVLTNGANAPMVLSVRPKDRPEIKIGKGSYREVGGEIVMDEPLLSVHLRDLNLDFYAFLMDRYFRVFTLILDVEVPVGLEVTEDGMLLPVLGDLDKLVTSIKAANSDILAEDPGVLQDILPMIIGMVEPMLDDVLDPIELPEFEGFQLDVQKIEGIVPHPESGRYEYIGLFARLAPAI